jgi:syntaxin 16
VQKFHQCQKLIKDVQMQAKGLQGTESTMAKNIQISLATKVQETSTQFRKKQSAYLCALGGNDRATTPSFLDDTSAPDYDVSLSQSALRQQQTQRPTNDASIVQREREIEDIARGILDLSELFKELQTMVIDQGTMLDRIDYNVELTRDRVKDAHVELRQVWPFVTGVDVVGFDVSKTVAEEDDYVIAVPGHFVVARYSGDETVAKNE